MRDEANAAELLSEDRSPAAWREYTVAGYVGSRIFATDAFLAPDLTYALSLARRQWPRATTVTCLRASGVRP